MKKVLVISIICLLLSSCDRFSNAKTPSIRNTTTDTATSQPTQTFTITPTKTPTPSSTPTNTATPTPTPSPTITPSLTPTVFGNTKGVLIGLCELRGCSEGRILKLDLMTGVFSQIGEDGYKLLDTSPDGKRILYAYKGGLYAMSLDGFDTRKISDGIIDSWDMTAYWLPSDEVVYIADEGKGLEAIHLISSDGTNLRKIVEQEQVLELLPAYGNDGIFWHEGSGATTRGLWWSNIYKDEHVELDYYYPSFSPTGQMVTYTTDLFASILHIGNTNGTYVFDDRNVYTSTEGIIRHHFISPDEKKILVYENYPLPDGSEYFQILNLVSREGTLINEYPIDASFFAVSWSPDSQLFMFPRRNEVNLLNLDTAEVTSFSHGIIDLRIVKTMWIIND